MTKTSPSTSIPVTSLAKLLLVSSFAFSSAMARSLDVSIEDELVKIAAEDVSVQEVLEGLTEQASLRLVQHTQLEQEVSLSIQGVTLVEAFELLLGSRFSYQLFLPQAGTDEAKASIPGTLWIIDRGVDQALAIDFLEAVLQFGQLGEKKKAIRSLRHIATPAAVQALSFALGDDDRRIRGAAIEALGAIGSEEALAALASTSSSTNPAERAAVADALAASGQESAQGYLKIALRDEDPRVRMAAADALGDFGGDIDKSQFQAALNDPDPQVRERVVEILEDMDDEAMFQALFPQHFID